MPNTEQLLSDSQLAFLNQQTNTKHQQNIDLYYEMWYNDLG